MKNIRFVAIVILLARSIVGCDTGYNRQRGQWVWTTQDEHHGRRHIPIVGVDSRSFRVLTNSNFGADNHSVYYQGRKVNFADPASFVTLTRNAFGYAKDRRHVFLDTEVILRADPSTFKVLEFPYSKDANDVYNGTLPMNLDAEAVRTFTVLNEDRLMYASKSTVLVSYFLEYSPQYRWINEYAPELKFVIVGHSGTGRSSTKRFKGLDEVKLK